MPTTDRVVEVAGDGLSLRVERKQLVITGADGRRFSAPLADTAVLLLSGRATLTSTVLASLAGQGGSAVVCDGKKMPVAMLLPLAPHGEHAGRIHLQAAAGLPLKKRLWQQLVRAKIRFQGETLRRLTGDDCGLEELAKKVTSGDGGNRESLAAQRYWKKVFGDPSFRRRRESDDQNKLLNYGYTILRSAVARAICAAGLHPAFGVHHHRQTDSFSLASDLMEPFRPLVDLCVAGIVQERGEDADLDPANKKRLAGLLEYRVRVSGEQVTLVAALSSLAVSLWDSLAGGRAALVLPDTLSGD